MSNMKPARGAKQAADRRKSTWMVTAVIAILGFAVISVVVFQTQLRQTSLARASAAVDAPAFDAVPTVTGSARLAVNQELFDYGDVKFNTPVETEIRVKNVGGQPLALSESAPVELVEGC